MEKIIKNIKKMLDYIIKNPVKAMITFVIIALGIGLIVFLLYVFLKEVVLPIAGFALLAWIFTGCPFPEISFNKKQKNLDFAACQQFILEVMTELTPQIHTIKPYGTESLHFADKTKSPHYSFIFNAEMTENAPYDDVSLMETKHILQERINDRLSSDKAYGIPYTIVYGVPSLCIFDITVAGTKYIYECVWVNNQAAYNHVNGRKDNQSNNTIPPNDDTF